MASLDVSLPEGLDDFVRSEVATGRFGSANDYICALVRDVRIERLHLKMTDAAIEKGRRSGNDPRPVEQIFADIRSGKSKAREPLDPMVTGEIEWPQDDELWDMQQVRPGRRELLKKPAQ